MPSTCIKIKTYTLHQSGQVKYHVAIIAVIELLYKGRLDMKFQAIYSAVRSKYFFASIGCESQAE